MCFSSSTNSCCCLNLHLEQRQGSSWLFRGRAMRGWPGACANVSVHSGVSWLACHSIQYRCARLLLAVWRACSSTSRYVCASMASERNRQPALLKIATRSTAGLSLAVPRSCNARLARSLRKCVGAFGGKLSCIPFSTIQMCASFVCCLARLQLDFALRVRKYGFRAQPAAGVA